MVYPLLNKGILRPLDFTYTDLAIHVSTGVILVNTVHSRSGDGACFKPPRFP